MYSLIISLLSISSIIFTANGQACGADCTGCSGVGQDAACNGDAVNNCFFVVDLDTCGVAGTCAAECGSCDTTPNSGSTGTDTECADDGLGQIGTNTICLVATTGPSTGLCIGNTCDTNCEDCIGSGTGQDEIDCNASTSPPNGCVFSGTIGVNEDCQPATANPTTDPTDVPSQSPTTLPPTANPVTPAPTTIVTPAPTEDCPSPCELCPVFVSASSSSDSSDITTTEAATTSRRRMQSASESSESAESICPGSSGSESESDSADITTTEAATTPSPTTTVTPSPTTTRRRMLLQSGSGSGSASESAEIETNDTICICPDGTTSLSGSSSSASNDSASSEDVVFGAQRNENENSDGIGALFGDSDNVQYHVSFSDFTLYNIWGIFALFLVVNTFLCYCCCWRKKSGNNQRELVDDGLDISKLEVMP